MDDGDVELQDNSSKLLNLESSSDFQALTSMNTVNESISSTRTCTHTHICNPPGPDAVHTHTCYHTHTQVFASEEGNKEHTKSKARRPSSNREAVRKYREKKKAQTAYLEEEVKKLHLQNQQLVRKLQKQVTLEAELSRLRSILIDLKRKIDSEFGVFPYKKQCIPYKNNQFGQISLPCLSPHAGSSSSQVAATCGSHKLAARWEQNCQPAIVDCRVNVDKRASTEEEEEEEEDDDDNDDETDEGDG